MIKVSPGQSMFVYGINVDYRAMEDSTKYVDPSAVLYPGRPVRLTSTSLVKNSDGSTITFGLAKSNKNSYVDDTFGEFGAYGSGKMSVVVLGMVTVRPNLYVKSDGTIDTINVWDTTKTYLVNDYLYCNASGLITNDSTGVTGSKFGYVLKPPATEDVTMEIRML